MQAGGATKGKAGIPGYMKIDHVRWVRDESGMTITYTMAGRIPEALPDLSGVSWVSSLGTRNSMDAAGSVTVSLFQDEWRVMAGAPDPNASSEYISVRPRLKGRTLTVRLPAQLSTDGGVLQISRTTHVATLVNGKTGLGEGTWYDGCPDDGGRTLDWENTLIRLK
ncbi:hypothetical protein LO771_13480 [Streptacidiphilus sp. ASG 303]|uniref:hypothetical protein n=1 Tax=Streptacidiphilus sp. ASG 303 TaxID=2896847 RepID=UPI001E534A54|nr:hypothetical protein [Streptacidiphilus sp. ASG 303]MCD0483386.1 hypothetical protein [Streptacidiphilus sp. ASG 303]